MAILNKCQSACFEIDVPLGSVDPCETDFKICKEQCDITKYASNYCKKNNEAIDSNNLQNQISLCNSSCNNLKTRCDLKNDCYDF